MFYSLSTIFEVALNCQICNQHPPNTEPCSYPCRYVSWLSLTLNMTLHFWQQQFILVSFRIKFAISTPNYPIANFSAPTITYKFSLTLAMTLSFFLRQQLILANFTCQICNQHPRFSLAQVSIPLGYIWSFADIGYDVAFFAAAIDFSLFLVSDLHSAPQIYPMTNFSTPIDTCEFSLTFLWRCVFLRQRFILAHFHCQICNQHPWFTQWPVFPLPPT